MLESFHLESVDAVDNVDELVLKLGVGLDGDWAGEEKIDGAIELGFGLRELTFAVGGLAEGVGVFDLLDDLADSLLVRSEVGQRRLAAAGIRGRARKGMRLGLQQTRRQAGKLR